MAMANSRYVEKMVGRVGSNPSMFVKPSPNNISTTIFDRPHVESNVSNPLN